jgi:hypothetical protein
MAQFRHKQSWRVLAGPFRVVRHIWLEKQPFATSIIFLQTDLF